MINKYLPFIVAGFIAYFSPIFGALFFVGFLVMADWITGMIKGAKLQTFTSRGVIRKFYTGAAYLVTIMVVRMAELYFGDEIPLVKPLVAIIALAEIQSLRENIEAITGTDLLKQLAGILQRNDKNPTG
jgi:hypothetical protein